MRKLGISFVLGLVAVVLAVQTPAQSAVPVTLIKAGRLLDPRTGNILAPAGVLIESGKIKQVGPPSQVQVGAPAGIKSSIWAVPHCCRARPLRVTRRRRTASAIVSESIAGAHGCFRRGSFDPLHARGTRPITAMSSWAFA
jgi:hypothetical protein